MKELITNPTEFGLPTWAQVSELRRQHIDRVVAVLSAWAAAMRLGSKEANAWVDAGKWHDAVRDAQPAWLRKIVGDQGMHDFVLHGHASAILLERDGETRKDVLDAIRFHTTGSKDWERTGQALFMADFLEPGRDFAKKERAELIARAPKEFDKVYERVVAMREEM